MQQQITLPADVYDALELSAEVHGGVGMGAYYRDEGPCCVRGHARFLDGPCVGDVPNLFVSGSVERAVVDAGLYVLTNDRIVARALREGKGDQHTRRLSWQEYVAAASIVRGDAEAN